jgi:hypothetical protein
MRCNKALSYETFIKTLLVSMRKWEIYTNKTNNTKINKNNGMMNNKPQEQRKLNDYHLIHVFMIYKLIFTIKSMSNLSEIVALAAT